MCIRLQKQGSQAQLGAGRAQACVQARREPCAVETCFIDDRDDMDLYGRKFDAVARAIADGVAEGFGKRVNDDKEDDTMTQKEFEEMYGKVNPLYKTISDVPPYWQPEVREMLDCGAINGGTDNNPDDVNMRHEALQAAIVAYRAAVNK